MIIFPNGVQGLSDTKWSGVRGSAHRLVGIDYRSTPGLIKAQQKLTKDSSTTVDELCKVGLPLSDGSKLWFSSQSGKIWRDVSGTYTLLGTLTIPGYNYRLSNAAANGITYNYSTQIGIPVGHFFSSDGLKLYVMGYGKVSGNNGEVFQYTLTTAYDISTASYATKTFAGDQQAAAFFFKPDGTKMYYVEDNGSTTVIEYSLSTAWDVSTASASGSTYNFSAQTNRTRGLFFKSDGTEMYIVDYTNQMVRQYTLGTAWNITTASYTAGFDATVSGTNTFNAHYGMYISSDGKNMLLCSSSGVGFQKFELTTAWDVTTAVYRNGYDVSSSNDFGLTAAHDGSAIYGGNQNSPETMYQFDLDGGAVADAAVTVLDAVEFAVPDGGVNQDEMTQYVYFCTKNWLFRVALADIASVVTDLNENNYLSLFTYGDDTYHPMEIANQRIFIGDKHTILEVNESGVITLQTDFSVREPERITNLHKFDVDLLISTVNLDTHARVLRWDTESNTWYGEDTLYEAEVHAFFDDENYTYALAGDFGQLFYYNGEDLVPHTRIPGTYTKTARAKINRHSVGYFMGVPVFGLSNIEGNPALEGVYMYGRYSKDYSVTMDLAFPISSGDFAGLELGAIVIQGADLYVAWKTASASGIDKIDWSNKYNGAYIETGVLNAPADRMKFKAIQGVLADYYTLPSGTSVAFQYSKNYAAYASVDSVVDTLKNQIRGTLTIPDIGAITLKFILTTSSNNSPEIENFHANFQEEESV